MRLKVTGEKEKDKEGRMVFLQPVKQTQITDQILLTLKWFFFSPNPG